MNLYSAEASSNTNLPGLHFSTPSSGYLGYVFGGRGAAVILRVSEIGNGILVKMQQLSCW